MQNPTQYAPCPTCGSTDATKVKFTWWGGALGPSIMTHVKCNHCGTQFNGKTGRTNQTNIIVYFATTFVIAFCVCGGLAFLGYFMNR